MSAPVVLDGHAALDVIFAQYAQKLAETWPGDEAIVGPDPSARRGEREDRHRLGASRARARGPDPATTTLAGLDVGLGSAIASLKGPRAFGKVSLVVSGWGDLVVVELEVEDLRTGRSRPGRVGSA
jgi:hypothetical protein